jgi:hypothetical protein
MMHDNWIGELEALVDQAYKSFKIGAPIVEREKMCRLVQKLDPCIIGIRQVVNANWVGSNSTANTSHSHSHSHSHISSHSQSHSHSHSQSHSRSLSQSHNHSHVSIGTSGLSSSSNSNSNSHKLASSMLPLAVFLDTYRRIAQVMHEGTCYQEMASMRLAMQTWREKKRRRDELVSPQQLASPTSNAGLAEFAELQAFGANAIMSLAHPQRMQQMGALDGEHAWAKEGFLDEVDAIVAKADADRDSNATQAVVNALRDKCPEAVVARIMKHPLLPDVACSSVLIMPSHVGVNHLEAVATALHDDEALKTYIAGDTPMMMLGADPK